MSTTSSSKKNIENPCAESEERQEVRPTRVTPAPFLDLAIRTRFFGVGCLVRRKSTRTIPRHGQGTSGPTQVTDAKGKFDRGGETLEYVVSHSEIISRLSQTNSSPIAVRVFRVQYDQEDRFSPSAACGASKIPLSGPTRVFQRFMGLVKDCTLKHVYGIPCVRPSRVQWSVIPHPPSSWDDPHHK